MTLRGSLCFRRLFVRSDSLRRNSPSSVGSKLFTLFPFLYPPSPTFATPDTSSFIVHGLACSASKTPDKHSGHRSCSFIARPSIMSKTRLTGWSMNPQRVHFLRREFSTVSTGLIPILSTGCRTASDAIESEGPSSPTRRADIERVKYNLVPFQSQIPIPV